MSASAYLHLARQWWWLLLAALAAGALTALAATALMTPTYESSATLLVSPARPPGAPVERTELEAGVLLANTYRSMVTARPILERASAEHALGLSPGALAERISLSSTGGSQVIDVSATGDSAAEAQAVVAAVTETFVVAPEVVRVGGADSVAVLSPANLPSSPVAPQPRLNAILGALFGLAVTGVVVLAIEYRDDRVRPGADVGRVTQLPVLARLRRFPADGDGLEQVLGGLRRGTPLGEEVRSARANLLHAMSGGEDQASLHRVLMVASPAAGEGKTTVAASIAVAFGLAGYRVLLLDADLRAPSQHRLFNAEDAPGLGDLLTDPALTLEDVARPTHSAQVDLVVGGASLSTPSELLGSMRMSALLEDARVHYDLVVVDTPGMVDASDALVLAGLVDCAVLLAREGQSRAGELWTATEQLQRSQAQVMGVLLNGSTHADGPDRPAWEAAFARAGALTRLARERLREWRSASAR